jgi:MFS family permease
MGWHLGANSGQLQWVVNAYAIAFAGFLMLGGRIADIFGCRGVFCLGLGVFTAASLAGGLASSPTMLLIARAVQGLGGSIHRPPSISATRSPSRRLSSPS